MTTDNQTNKNSKNVPLRDGGHDFDGIQELDNDLPKWWVNLFLLTIVFAVGYLAWYHIPGTPALNQQQEYLAEKAAFEKTLLTQKENQPSEKVGFDFIGAQQDSNIVAAGKAAYDTNCAACHGQKGEGIVGPNLTDKFWIHGFTSELILGVVLNGEPAKGMPAWKDVLGKTNAQNIVTYIATLQNSNPPNAKAPQGPEGQIKW